VAQQTEHARRAHLGLGRLRAWPNLGCLLFGLCTTVVVLAGFRTGPPTPNPISFGPKIEGVRHFSSLIFMQIFLGPARLQVPITTESLWPIRVGIALLRARSSWSNKDYGERSLQSRRNIFLLATPGTLLWCCWFIMNPSVDSVFENIIACWSLACKCRHDRPWCRQIISQDRNWWCASVSVLSN